MIVPSIKSRPVYGLLRAKTGTAHVILVDLDGADAVLDMAKTAPLGFFAQATMIVVTGERFSNGASPLATGRWAALQALNPAAFLPVPTLGGALPKLAQLLATARMGTHLYLAGTEGLIGQATALAVEAGMEQEAIVTEHRGSLARRVQCVHCKGFTDDVTTQPVTCSHCGLTLFVRDHYSRRLGAFQGVCIDAEVPGTVPPTEDVFA